MILRQSILSLLFAAFVFAQNPFASNTRIPVGAGPASIAVSDFNGDGKKDLAVANKTDKNISVLLGNGAGGFANAPGSPLLMDPDGYGGPGLITAGDFNGDGKLDILYADDRFFQLGPMSYASGPTLAIRLGNGDGTFAPSLGPLASVSSQWARMRSADVNGDGKLDVIGDGPGTGSTSPVLNGSYLNGDGTG